MTKCTCIATFCKHSNRGKCGREARYSVTLTGTMNDSETFEMCESCTDAQYRHFVEEFSSGKNCCESLSISIQSREEAGRPKW